MTLSATAPSGYRSRHDYRVELLARCNRVTVRAGDRIIADSSRTILVDEQDHALVFYIPDADVSTTALIAIPGKSTYCPYKGTATYLALTSVPSRPIAWRYDAPFAQVASLAGHVAFYHDRVDLRVAAASD